MSPATAERVNQIALDVSLEVSEEELRRQIRVEIRDILGKPTSLGTNCGGCEYFSINGFISCAVHPKGPEVAPCPDWKRREP